MNKHFNLEEQKKLFLSGSDDDLTTLLLSFTSLVYQISRNFHKNHKHIPLEDFIQEGLLESWRKIRHWNPNLNRSLSTFLFYVVRNKFIKVCNSAEYNSELICGISADKDTKQTCPRKVSVTWSLVKDGRNNADPKMVEDLIEGLEPKNKEIIKYYWGVLGYPKMSYNEISNQFSIDRRQVKKIIHRSMSQLKKMVDNNGK